MKLLTLLIGVASIILVGLFYYKITLEDSYFPSYDPYNTKTLAASIDRNFDLFSVTSEPLFLYTIHAFAEVSGISYYEIIRFGNFAIILLCFAVLYLFLKDYVTHPLVAKLFLPICLALFFLYPISLKRFTMPLRENLIVAVGFFFLYLLNKLDSQ